MITHAIVLKDGKELIVKYRFAQMIWTVKNSILARMENANAWTKDNVEDLQQKKLAQIQLTQED